VDDDDDDDEEEEEEEIFSGEAANWLMISAAANVDSE